MAIVEFLPRLVLNLFLAFILEGMKKIPEFKEEMLNKLQIKEFQEDEARKKISDMYKESMVESLKKKKLYSIRKDKKENNKTQHIQIFETYENVVSAFSEMGKIFGFNITFSWKSNSTFFTEERNKFETFWGIENDRIVFNSLEKIIDETELFDDENEEMERNDHVFQNEEEYEDFQLALSDLARSELPSNFKETLTTLKENLSKTPSTSKTFHETKQIEPEPETPSQSSEGISYLNDLKHNLDISDEEAQTYFTDEKSKKKKRKRNKSEEKEDIVIPKKKKRKTLLKEDLDLSSDNYSSDEESALKKMKKKKRKRHHRDDEEEEIHFTGTSTKDLLKHIKDHTIQDKIENSLRTILENWETVHNTFTGFQHLAIIMKKMIQEVPFKIVNGEIVFNCCGCMLHCPPT